MRDDNRNAKIHTSPPYHPLQLDVQELPLKVKDAAPRPGQKEHTIYITGSETHEFQEYLRATPPEKVMTIRRKPTIARNYQHCPALYSDCKFAMPVLHFIASSPRTPRLGSFAAYKGREVL